MRRINRPFFAFILFLCFTISGLASVYYLSSIVPPYTALLVNNFGAELLGFHAGAGALALAIGPFQFLPGLRAKRPRLHHLAGQIFVLSALISGSVGLILAFGTTSGPWVTLGLGSMAVAWLISTVMGVRAAIQGRLADHRAWMLRSFSLTFVAVTLRLELPLMIVLGVDSSLAYIVSTYLCWIPNLIVVQLWLTFARSSLVPAKTVAVTGAASAVAAE